LAGGCGQRRPFHSLSIDAAPASPRCVVTDPAGTPLPECRGDQEGQILKRFLASEDGVTSVEYALIASPLSSLRRFRASARS
jgi:hypothetical protein